VLFNLFPRPTGLEHRSQITEGLLLYLKPYYGDFCSVYLEGTLSSIFCLFPIGGTFLIFGIIYFFKNTSHFFSYFPWYLASTNSSIPRKEREENDGEFYL
jgi:hypothetical protein